MPSPPGQRPSVRGGCTSGKVLLFPGPVRPRGLVHGAPCHEAHRLWIGRWPGLASSAPGRESTSLSARTAREESGSSVSRRPSPAALAVRSHPAAAQTALSEVGTSLLEGSGRPALLREPGEEQAQLCAQGCSPRARLLSVCLYVRPELSGGEQ